MRCDPREYVAGDVCLFADGCSTFSRGDSPHALAALTAGGPLDARDRDRRRGLRLLRRRVLRRMLGRRWWRRRRSSHIVDATSQAHHHPLCPIQQLLQPPLLVVEIGVVPLQIEQSWNSRGICRRTRRCILQVRWQVERRCWLMMGRGIRVGSKTMGRWKLDVTAR